MRRSIWSVIGVLSCLLLLASTAPHAQQPGVSTGEYVVRAPASRINDIAARHGLTIVRQLPGQDVFVVTRNASTPTTRTTSGDVAALPPPQTQLTDIAGDPDVYSFEPNAVVTTPEVATPLTLNGSVVAILDGISDTSLTNYFDHQVWVRYVDQPATAAIGLTASHATAGTGAGIVAIIDTGVDPNHPALAGSLVPGYDFVHETAGIPSEWSDVDGSVVAILDGSVVAILDGRPVTINGSVVAILDQAQAASLDPTLLPSAFGHGTMVAGLVHLVAPTAQIMALKAFHADGTSSVFDVVRAIYYAVDHGARVINMSFSATAPSPEITHAINYATSHGVICVASAGNLGQETVVYPGGLRNVVGVGSTSSTTPATRSAFSNYGNALVSLGAPGEAVITTYPGAHFAAAWGTSFSAPLAAGGAALLLRVDPSVNPGKAAELLGNAQPMNVEGMGKGRLSLPDAVHGAADTVLPTISLSSPAGGGSLFGSVLISASASDNVAVASVRFVLDGNPLGQEITAAPFERMWATTSVANGTHTLTAIARDRSGNEGTSVATVTVANDTGAPTVTLLSPQQGASLSGTVTVTAAAADDLEVRGVRFTVDGAPLGVEDTAAPYEAVWTTTSGANGTHVIAAVARDGAGHETRTSATVTVGNDLAAPTVTLTSPTAGATLSGTVPLTATAQDDVGVVSLTFLVDGVVSGVQTPAGRTWNTATVVNGPHVVSVVARDAVGHETTASAEVTVHNDIQAPAIDLTTPVANATLHGLVSVMAVASDDIGVTGVQFKVDGAPIGAEDVATPYEALWNTAAASNGSHIVSAVARDAVGRETVTTVVVAVENDAAPPTVALSNPTGGAQLSGTVPVSVSAGDDIGVTSVQFLVDGVAAGAPITDGPYQWSWDTDGAVANGSHTVSAVAHDAAGHETTTSVAVTVANDHVAPTLTLTGPTGAVGGTVSIVATAADDVGVVSVEFLADGTIPGPVATAAPYAWSWNTAGVANGAHTVWALARDAAGRETVTSIVVTVANDTAAPVVAFVNPVGGATVSGTTNVIVTATDDVGVTSVQFLVDGVVASAPITAQPYQWSWATRQLGGLHTVTAVARDAAGHESTASVQVTVVEDVPPTP